MKVRKKQKMYMVGRRKRLKMINEGRKAEKEVSATIFSHSF
jgi:hypothetical protein